MWLNNYKSYRGLYAAEEPNSASCAHEVVAVEIGGCVYVPFSRPLAIALYVASDGCVPSHDPYLSGLSHTLKSPTPHAPVADIP